MNKLQELKEKRNNLFTPGHIDSYRRDRYDLWDEYTNQIREIENEGLVKGSTKDEN